MEERKGQNSSKDVLSASSNPNHDQLWHSYDTKMSLKSSLVNTGMRTRKTKKQMRKELGEISRLISEGYANREIINSLKLKASTFYRYRRMLFEECTTSFTDHRMVEEVGFNSEVLHERLLKLYRLTMERLEHSINDPNAKDFSNVVTIGEELAVNLFHLATQGIEAAQEIAKRLKASEYRMDNQQRNQNQRGRCN